VSSADSRISVLEERADNVQGDHDQLVDKVDAIAKDVHEIKEKLSNWRGFVSGMVFTIATLAGLIGAGATWLYHRLAN
jgi:hypothetical protein